MPTRAAELARLCGWLAVLLSAASPALAAPSPEFAAGVRQLQTEDARLNTIGFRLASANAAFCRKVVPSAGVLLADVAAYDNPADLRSVLGIAQDFAIEAVATGSPAELAGVRAGSEVLEIEGRKPSEITAMVAPGGVARLNALHDAIDAALLAKGSLRLALSTGSATVGAIPVCRARFELATGGNGARAGTLIVQVSRAVLGEADGESEAAFLVAHELAHIVLGHGTPGRSARQINEDEREADRLAPWLMANGGYDPAAGSAFLRRWGGKGLRGLGDLSHDSPSARARRVEAELRTIAETSSGETGKRDWRSRFTPARTAP